MSEVTARSALEAVLKMVTPHDERRASAARHRTALEEWLRKDLGIVRMRETGSWHHGTALWIGSDVDYFVTMPGSRPADSSTALEKLRSSLVRGVPGTPVWIDRPAVRIAYDDGGPAVEIMPAYYRETDDYDIPNPDGSGWIRSNPAVHLDYVNRAQKATEGRAKGLIRLVKAWKLLNAVPLSSFHLEMRTAKHAIGNAPIIYDWDLRDLFSLLKSDGLRDMNDPTDYGRRIATGASSTVELVKAQLAVERAAKLTASAREATDRGDHGTAARTILDLYDMGR